MDVEDAGSVRGWARLRRPVGLVEQTRWNLWLAVLLALVMLGPWPFTSLSPVAVPLAAVAAGCLIACWAYRYFSRGSPLLLDLAEVAATAVLASACPSPTMVLGVALLAQWFRSLYGSNQQVVLFSLLLSSGIAASLLLWGLLPGRDRLGSPTAVLASIPVMLLTMAVARHLALGLFTRSQSRQRDTALVQLGHELIGVTDKATIYHRARAAAVAICRATPEMRALFLHGEGDIQLVVGQAGPFRRALRSLPRAVFPVDADRHVGP